MYVKTLKKTKEWRFGIEYFYSEVGDVLYVNPDAGFAMRAAGVAELAPFDEIPQDDEITAPSGATHSGVFQFIRADLAAKGRK